MRTNSAGDGETGNIDDDSEVEVLEDSSSLAVGNKADGDLEGRNQADITNTDDSQQTGPAAGFDGALCVDITEVRAVAQCVTTADTRKTTRRWPCC